MLTSFGSELSSAADRLLLDEATPLLSGTVVVLDAPELALRVASLVGTVRVALDSAEAAEGFPGFDPDIPLETKLAAADVVILRLPKSLDRLNDVARLVATHARPNVNLVAGGMLKYMTRSMNEVLGRSFGDVHASLARQKARVLFARGPLSGPAAEPRRTHLDDFDLDVVAWGGVFAGAALDIGTRALLSTFDKLPAFETAIDFGCGTGILASQLKRARPSARVIASDDSDAAVRSAAATAAANGLAVEVQHESLLRDVPDASADLIVLNPPFHDGGPVSLEAAHWMFVAAARKLKPGGELRTVWNSNLAYRAALTRSVGPTTELARTPKFTVTRSLRQAS